MFVIDSELSSPGSSTPMETFLGISRRLLHSYSFIYNVLTIFHSSNNRFMLTMFTILLRIGFENRNLGSETYDLPTDFSELDNSTICKSFEASDYLHCQLRIAEKL